MNDTPKKGWFQRLSAGLSRSSKQMTDQVVATFVKEPLSEASLEQLEEHLLESDLGPAASARIVERFRSLKFGKFNEAMRRRADQIVVVSRFRFTRDAGLQTQMSSQ